MAQNHKSIKWIKKKKTIRRNIAQHQFYDDKIPAASEYPDNQLLMTDSKR